MDEAQGSDTPQSWVQAPSLASAQVQALEREGGDRRLVGQVDILCVYYMYVCMCVYMCVCVCVCVHIYIHIHVCIYVQALEREGGDRRLVGQVDILCVYTYVCMGVYVCVCVCVCEPS
jgi:hypothetical protein